MPDAALRCPLCSGMLEFSFYDISGNVVYRCGRCSSDGIRYFKKNDEFQLIAVKARKHDEDWIAEPIKPREPHV